MLIDEGGKLENQLSDVKQAFKNATIQLQLCRQSIIQKTREAAVFENIKKDLVETYEQFLAASH